jgi:integrase
MRGDGNVFKPDDSQYFHYVFWDDGKRVHGSTGKTDEAEARRVLAKKRDAARRGDEVPHEDRVRLRDFEDLLVKDYVRKGNKSTATMQSTFKHLKAFFGERAKAIRLAGKSDEYIARRREEGAAIGSIRIEIALLNRAGKLAVKKKMLSPRSWSAIELPAEDKKAVRRGFFRRADLERLAAAVNPKTGRPCLSPALADMVTFLFFCPWRVGAVRRLEWRDYSEADSALTLRPELNKTGHELAIPIDEESTPELMAILNRQRTRRRPACPFIFHGRSCGTERRDRNGNRRPCLGDFQKVWDQACAAIGMAGRIPHDLRRSGVKHYIDAGVDPHTVMRWSGHRTAAMLRRYHIIDLEDLRRAGKKASQYRGPGSNVRSLVPRTAPEPPQAHGKSKTPEAAVVEVAEC